MYLPSHCVTAIANRACLLQLLGAQSRAILQGHSAHVEKLACALP